MDFGPKQTVKEGAAEVKAKLREDFSRWSQARRAVSIKPTVTCGDCYGRGTVPCITCDGSGKAKFVLGETADACATCNGKGTVTCTECSGRRIVPNVHRKKILWVLVVGGLGWAFVLWTVLGRDVAPETIAKLKGGGGRSTGSPSPLGARAPGPSGANTSGAAVLTPGSGAGMVPRQPIRGYGSGSIGRPPGRQ